MPWLQTPQVQFLMWAPFFFSAQSWWVIKMRRSSEAGDADELSAPTDMALSYCHGSHLVWCCNGMKSVPGCCVLVQGRTNDRVGFNGSALRERCVCVCIGTVLFVLATENIHSMISKEVKCVLNDWNQQWMLTLHWLCVPLCVFVCVCGLSRV